MTDTSNDTINQIIDLLSPHGSAESPEIDIEHILKDVLGGSDAATQLLSIVSSIYEEVKSIVDNERCRENLANHDCIESLRGVLGRDDIQSMLVDALKRYLINGSRNCNEDKKENYAEKIVDELNLDGTTIRSCNDRDLDESDKAYCIIVSILKEIPRVARRVHNENEHGKCSLQARLLWLLDTCYDANRAKNLLEKLHNIRTVLEGSDGDLFRKFLLLTIGAYAAAVVKPDRVWEFDWYLSLVHAASEKALPLCPSRGDVAALAYLAKTLSILYGKDKYMKGKITKANVLTIIEKLLDP